MRRRLLPVVACAAALSCGAASAATAPRSVTTPGPLVGIAADGARLAYADGASPGDCGGVRVWALSTRATPRLNGTRWCPSEVTSTGAGLVGPAFANGRALWLSYAGGNSREWTLWTSTPGRSSPTAIRAVTRDVDGPPPMVLGPGDQELLPYGFDRQVIVLRSNGARRFAWDAPARVAAVAAGSGRVAVLLETGAVRILSSAGAVVEQHAYPPGAVKEVRTSGADLVVRLAGRLEAWRDGTRTVRPIPAGGALRDVVAGIAVYVAGRDVRGVRLADGRDVLLRRAVAPGPLAEVESASGLFVGVAGTAVLVPYANVLAAFA